ncbi:MAG: virulence protein RhuM/Fic/DOC family protein [Rickettsiales bacterium]|nr:virulence protein RhuM/Fic/DOC family protein [Rickettsiales bacterium]
MTKINKKNLNQLDSQPLIYQAKDGSIELKSFVKSQTIWASKKQIAQIFGVDRSVVSKHIKNIFLDQELDQKVVCANFAQTTSHGAIKGKEQTNNLEHYNLDIILAVGYRTKSSLAIEFRKWATRTLKKHITEGFTINKKLISQNHQKFLKAIEDIKILSNNNKNLKTGDVLELIKSFSYTWFSLDNFDKGKFPIIGSKKSIKINAKELMQDIAILKAELIAKKEATAIFATEKNQGALEGILGNVFQSVFGEDAYSSLEKKAANLLYFIVKNHPFNDGNKRSGAFAFIWFLQKAKFEFQSKINPQTLAILTILIAESNPKEKDKIIGLILTLLKN